MLEKDLKCWVENKDIRMYLKKLKTMLEKELKCWVENKRNI